MKKYFAILLIIFVSCKCDILITGLATNSKDGALIRNQDGVYIIEGKEVWEDSLNNRNVQAKIKVISETKVSKSDLNGEKKTLFKQGRIGTTFISKLKKIKVLK